MKLIEVVILILPAFYMVHPAENKVEDAAEAQLLVSKNILNLYLVEGKDLTVQYSIYNVGRSYAFDTHLKDDSFPHHMFDAVHGNVEVQWERIAPNSNVSHIVIFCPLIQAFYNFSSAEISYLAIESASDRQVVYSSAPGDAGIVSGKEFDRRFSPHLLDWIVFAVMTLPSLGIPFLLWKGSNRKYNCHKGKKSH